ncbi:MAG: hypothetical protein WC792_03090 [Candidatus Micrarchaeia archaeon]|jgi:hypothetical protein
MLYGMENRAYGAFERLVDGHGLCGIKCEFEAEGSTFEDVVRLREICSKKGVELHLKIGGGEAKRDVLDAAVLGVDGIIAPMIESDFAAFKFQKLIETVYPDKSNRPHIAINIETRTSAENFEKITARLSGFLGQITFGRTDLSGSYFDKEIFPDSDFIIGLVKKHAASCHKQGLKVAMGGSISVKTVQKLRDDSDFCKLVDRIETRKCILPSKEMLREGALESCLEFEKLYLMSLRERSEVRNKSNIERLLKLEQRGVV